MQTIAIDTETFLISRENPSPKNVCLSWCDGNKSDIIIHGEDLVEWLYKKLIDDNIQLVGHNIAYDMCSLLFSYEKYDLAPYIFRKYRKNLITDTMLRQQLFDIAVGRTYKDDKISAYSLASLWKTIFHTQAPNYESKIKENPNSWRLRYNELYDIPLQNWPKDAVEYAILDSEITWAIWDAQEEASEYFRDDNFQAYSYFCLNFASIKGMKTSPRKTILFRREQQRIYDSYIPELQKAELISWDAKKEKWVKKLDKTRELIKNACRKKNREPKLTDKGQIATDKEAVYWSEDPLLIRRMKFVQVEKILTTYVPALREGYEFPISTRFNLAATGRTTSSAPREPLVGTNLQNMPRDGRTRNCFIPREGNVYLAADFAGAELHCLAQVCKYLIGFSELGDALNAGIDIHSKIGAEVMGINYDDFVLRVEQNDSETEHYRFYAKMANFGFGGGMVGKTWCKNQLIKTGKIIDVQFGNMLRKNWLRAWPEMPKFFAYVKRLLSGTGDTTIELFHSRRLRYIKSFTVGCNTYFQSLAADGGKMAVNEITRHCYNSDIESALYRNNCFLVNFVHDEPILEIPKLENSLAERQCIVNEFCCVAENEFNKVVPDYPTTVEPVLMDCWNKKAKSIWDNEILQIVRDE